MKKIKFLSMLFAFVFSIGFLSCSNDDDDDNGGSIPVAPNGTINPGLVNGRYLTGVGKANIEYDETGRVASFTDNGYYNEGWDDDGSKYIVSYNPFEIAFTDGENNIKVSGVTFTKEGYIKSIKMVRADSECTEKETWNLTYDDGYLTKIDATGDFTENYGGESYSGKYKGKLDIKWNNGNMDKVQITTISSENGYTSTDTTSYVFSYGNEENIHRQPTPAQALDFNEHVEILVYLGYFGKAGSLLPKTLECRNTWIEDDYHTVFTQRNSYDYSMNSDGMLKVVYNEIEQKETTYNEVGEIAYQYDDVYDEQIEYRYDKDAPAPMESKAVKRSKKSNRRGFLSR